MLIADAAGHGTGRASACEIVARIACADCPGPALLTGVRDIALFRDRIHVLDGSAPHVRIFDAQGRSIRSWP